jgi:hypothetical protein
MIEDLREDADDIFERCENFHSHSNEHHTLCSMGGYDTILNGDCVECTAKDIIAIFRRLTREGYYRTCAIEPVQDVTKLMKRLEQWNKCARIYDTQLINDIRNHFNVYKILFTPTLRRIVTIKN